MAINRDKVSASAIKHLQSGKFDRAIGELQKLVEDDPKDVRTLLKLGDTYVKVGQRDSAISSYQAVADVYSEQGFYLKAVAVFKQMLRVDGNLPDVHMQLAEMYQQLGLHSDCMQHFQQVAVYHERQGDLGKTLDVLKRMVDLDPDNLPSRIKLAELFAQQGHNDKAIEEFRSAADYLKGQERHDDFIRVAERLVYFDPSAIDVTRELATLYLRRGDAKLALGKLQTCFKADPRNLETLTLIAEAFLAMDQVVKTISVYKEIARIHESTGNAPEAQRHWNRVLELVPDDAEAQQALGMVGMPTAAGASTAAPVAAAPAPAPASVDPEEEQVARLLTETDVYVKYGLRDKALEHLNKVIAMRPDLIEAHDKMRDLYQQMGNRAGLIDELSSLIELGTAQGDPRLTGWQRDFEALTGGVTDAPGPAGPPPVPMTDHGVIDADDADGLIELVDDDDGGGDEEELLLDPGLGDEPMLGDDLVQALPPDESVLEEEVIDEDALLEPSDEGVLALDESGDDADAAAAFLDSMSGGVGPAPVDVPEMVDDGDLGELDGLGDALGAELAAAAAAGIAQLSGEASETGNAIDDPLSDLGSVEGGDSFFDEAAFAAAASGIDDAARAAAMPEEEANFASTEIMSLSPEEMAEIQAMAQPSHAGGAPAGVPEGFDMGDGGLGDRVASGQMVSGGDFDDFTDATQALSADDLESLHSAADALSRSEEELIAGAASDIPSSEQLNAEEEAEIAAEMAAYSNLESAPVDSDYRDATDAIPGMATLQDDAGFDLPAGDDQNGGAADALLGDDDDWDKPADLDLGGEEGTGDDAMLLDSGEIEALDDDDLLGLDAKPTGTFVPDGALLDDGDLDSQPAPPLPAEFDSGGDLLDEFDDGDLTTPNLGDDFGNPLVSADSELDDPYGADLEAAAEAANVSDDFASDAPEGTDPGMARHTLEDEEAPSHDDSSASLAASGDPVGASAESSGEEPRKPKLGVSTSAYGFEDDPAAAFYPDELEEAEFFLNTELIDEAREILLEIQEDVDDSPRVAWMLARCDAKENGEPEPPAPWAEKVLEVVEEEVGDLFDNLGAPEPSDGQISVDEVLAAFKKGVAEQIDEGDAETHYNLGIAYREMGLVDDAIGEFEMAAKAPGKAADARHLIGLCHIDQGDHEKALEAFTAALSSGDLPPAQVGANEYQLGICYEALGKPAEARGAFERAKEHGAAQQDIDQRLANLPASTNGSNGHSGVTTPAGGLGSAEDDAPSRKKIDYL